MAAQKRNLALFAWNPLYRNLFLGLVLLSLIIPLVVFFDMRRHKKRGKASGFGVLSYCFVIFGLVIALGIPVLEGSFSVQSDKEPQLMLIDQTGASGYPDVALVWYTQRPSVKKLAYGTSPENLKTVVEEEKPQKSHALIFSNLSRGETYYYTLGTEPTVRSFQYFPESEQGIRLAVSSDAHVGAETNDLGATRDILSVATDSDNRFSLLCNLGDVVEMGNSDKQISDQIEFFSTFTTSIPLIQVLGNHDGWFGGHKLWADYYYPEVLPGDNRLYHRFDLTPSIHILTLDLEWGTESYDPDQKAWFLAQLDSLDPEDVIVVMNHAYYFGSSTEYQGVPWYDNQEMIDMFHDLYVEHGVDLVFSGHDHQLEHISQDGVDYFIVGAFGGKFDDEPTYVSPGSLFRDFANHGYADVSLQDSKVSVVFRDPKGSALYSWEKPLD
jgi:predicted phosphodiesterase